jgi:hypothetical protein
MTGITHHRERCKFNGSITIRDTAPRGLGTTI